ncbi:hypothetical protein [Chitinophaga pinensis]|uniref:Uncharacterized protein n=1 Tax=Chitinophaga pinensis (strain ATCC 43595 / DSM 2588 / LMG 13176 / NBRC 15968 / NCIMB 11800 / UQM 2034) TaxID=485918 RepID=A0A979G731_CHIPD|nr:hypothetical protein [Chitinophaga pinensis]ACU61933.1 hypothetical protein Cpin_4491 [Chitinophaga pinensis DSM 2588]
MSILALRILPPIAIGRLGASQIPVAAYDLVVPENKPLDFRQIAPQATLTIDPSTNQIKDDDTPPPVIIFKEGNSTQNTDVSIRPVAPFLELYAITSDDANTLVPVTQALLEKHGYKLENISWSVNVGNLKVFRRTGKPADKIIAKIENITSNDPQPLKGLCDNFYADKWLPLGIVQYVKPSAKYPGLRFRFTPGPGKVYGSSTQRIEAEKKDPVADPIINSEDLVLYNPAGGWLNYAEGSAFNPTYTMPAQIFAGYDKDNGDHVSWGYLDDECDGEVTATLQGTGASISATAHIVAGPPAYAPDILPIRAVSDEIEQIFSGVDPDAEVSIDEAEDIVRRAFESITLMNTAVMNGNPINGRENVASTMVRQDTNDFGRLYEPIMASSIVDNLALRTLHERVFNGLSTGAAAWFASALRRPYQIGDLSNAERSKMPGMMRGADGRGLTLTYRMINNVVQAATDAMFKNGQASPGLLAPPQPGEPIAAADLKAQLFYRGAGNPYSVLARAAISNCFPGLEFDFRNLWRHTFEGLTLSENDNYVLEDNSGHNLTGHRLIGINGQPTMVRGEGPVFPGGDNVHLKTEDNPNGAAFMEWSNLIAGLKLGQTAELQFTTDVATLPVLVTADDLKTSTYPKLTFNVNSYLAKDAANNKTAALNPAIVSPGELTHGLCAPWQNDYRECACYYWAASRPDYVNVQPGDNGLSKGDMWLSKRRTGTYIPDNRTDSRLFSYDDLFLNWQGELNFIIDGKDALASNPLVTPLQDASQAAKASRASKSGDQVHSNPSLIDE